MHGKENQVIGAGVFVIICYYILSAFIHYIILGVVYLCKYRGNNCAVKISEVI